MSQGRRISELARTRFSITFKQWISQNSIQHYI